VAQREATDNEIARMREDKASNEAQAEEVRLNAICTELIRQRAQYQNTIDVKKVEAGTKSTALQIEENKQADEGHRKWLEFEAQLAALQGKRIEQSKATHFSGRSVRENRRPG
jgi:hypothetical protein